MNREDVAKDLAVENNEVLRGRLEQADALFREYDKHGHSEGWWRRVTAFLASQQGKQCKTCGGTRIVDDGEIWCSEGGIPHENGPVKCVKDCPSCTGKHPEQAEGAQGEREAFEAWFATSGRAESWSKSSGLHLPKEEAIAHYLKTYGPDKSYNGCCTQELWKGWQARAALAQPSPAPELDFSKPLETEKGEPVKWICADVIEYKGARVCVAQDTGLVYSSPYIGLKIRNAVSAPELERPEIGDV